LWIIGRWMSHIPPWIVVLSCVFLNLHKKSMRSTGSVLIFCVFGVASLAVWCVKCEVSCKVHAGPLQNSEARLVGSGWRMGPKWVVLSWLCQAAWFRWSEFPTGLCFFAATLNWTRTHVIPHAVAYLATTQTSKVVVDLEQSVKWTKGEKRFWIEQRSNE
jgi:hypothetical protein